MYKKFLKKKIRVHKDENRFEKIFIKNMHIKYEIFMKKQGIFICNWQYAQLGVMTETN